MALSILTFVPEQSCPSWYVLVASVSMTSITDLSERRIQVSTTLTKKNPGYFSRAIRRPDINAQYSSQGGFLLAIQSTKFSTQIQSFFLYSPNYKSHPCWASDSEPPGTKLRKTFRATDSTTFSVISAGIRIDILLYTSSVERGGSFWADIFYSTIVTDSSVTPVLSDSPAYLLQTDLTAPHNFPRRTRFEKVWCCYSTIWFLRAPPRYTIAAW